MRLFTSLAACLIVAGTSSAAPWQTDYATALKVAKKLDKPLLVIFTDSESETNARSQLLAAGGDVDAFVVLFAQRQSPTGQQLFQLFGIHSDKAIVVVERNQQWQFCRYERELTREELAVVLSGAATAKGKPNGDVLLARGLGRLETSAASAGHWSPESAMPVNCRT